MKTQTYLRWSLLIPFLVWGLSLIIFLIAGATQADKLSYDDPLTIMTVLGAISVFYVFGVIVWGIPYLLLAAILFFWSFIARAKTALRVFALSPLAMMLLTLAVMNIILLTSGDIYSFTNPSTMDDGTLSMNLMAAAFVLIWGYLCVGIGYGIYILLQRRGWIRDEEIQASVPDSLNQLV